MVATPIAKGTWGAVAAASTSASQTASAASGQYLFVVGMAQHASTDPVKPVLTNSAGSFTWVEVGDHIYSAGKLRITMWVADVSAGFTSTFTITSTGASNVAGLASLWSSIDASSFLNVAYGDSASGDPTFTLGTTLTSGSAVYYAAFGVGGALSFTPTAGFTELADVVTVNHQITHGYDLTAPPATVALTSTNTASTIIGVEIKNAPVAVFSAPTAELNITGTGPSQSPAAVSQAAASNQYLFVVGVAQHASLDPDKPTPTNSGTALTWVEVADHIYTGIIRTRMTVWYANVSAGYPSTTFTITSANSDAVAMLGSIWRDVDTTALSNFAFGDNAAGDPTVSLGTLAGATSAVFTAGFSRLIVNFLSLPAGYTPLDSTLVSVGRIETLYDLLSPSTSIAFTSSGDDSFAFALELRPITHDFTDVDAFGTGSSKTGNNVTTGPSVGAVDAGRLVIVCIASDNTGTTDAAGQDDIASVTDSAGNTYTFAAGYRNGQGAAAAGAHASIWYSIITNALVSSSTITITNTTSGRARALFAGSSYAIGPIISVVGTASAAADGGTDPSVTLSGLAPDTEYLWVGCVADENNAIPGAAAGFTLLDGGRTTGGSATTNMAVGHYYARETATSKTFAPAVVGDAAAVLVAFKAPQGNGYIAATETGSDTAVFTGELSRIGTLAVTETGLDTAVFTGTVAISATLDATEVGSDTAALTGTLTRTGTLTATESGPDTAVITGQVRVASTLAATETGEDTAAIIGSISVAAVLFATETGADTAAISGTVPISGSLVATEVGTDTAAIGGVVAIAGTIAAVEVGADNAAFSGIVLISGILDATETGSDTAVFAGGIEASIEGALDATEVGSDTAAFDGSLGSLAGTGDLAAQEAGSDTASLVGDVAVAASLTAQEEGSDSAALTSALIVTGALVATEAGSDTAVFDGVVVVHVTLEAFESDSDTAVLTGTVALDGSLIAAETGSDTAAFDATVAAAGFLDATEIGSDTAVFAGGEQATIGSIIEVTETGSDTAEFTGSLGLLGVAADLIAEETGSDTAAIDGVVQRPDLNAFFETQEVGSDTASFVGSVEGAVIEEERDRLGTSSTRFESRRHKPRKRKPLTLTKPLTEEQVRHLKDKGHEKRRAIWERPKPTVERPTVVETARAFIQSDKRELEAAKTAVAIARARVELAELRKQRSEVDIRRKSTRFKKQSENVARLQQVLAEREQRVKEAELIHTRNQEAVVALLLAA